MSKMLFILMLLGSLVAKAQILGALKGDGKIQASYSESNGSTTTRTSPCHVAMNIRESSSSFALDFSYFECPQLSIWNDGVYRYHIVGGKLVNGKGEEKGVVAMDGTYHISESSFKTEKYVDYHYDENCNYKTVENKILKLNTAIKYSFKHMADGSWSVRRLASEDRLAWTSRREHGCPTITVPTKLGSSTELSVVLR